MRDYLLLEEFAAAWSEDRGETMEETRAEIFRMFWEGRFERMGPKHGPGTRLSIREENRGSFPDQWFDGMRLGRKEFLIDVFLTGPCSLPAWRQWSQVIQSPDHNYDPEGGHFKLRYLHHPDPAMLQEGFVTLRDCPFEKYSYPADAYLRSLAFPIEMLSRYFTERSHNRPPFLVKAQARLSGARKVTSGKAGRPRYAFDETRLRDWFSVMVERLDADGQTISADEAHNKAKSGFHPDVPRRLIRDLHRELAPESWRRPGPKARV